MGTLLDEDKKVRSMLPHFTPTLSPHNKAVHEQTNFSESGRGHVRFGFGPRQSTRRAGPGSGNPDQSIRFCYQLSGRRRTVGLMWSPVSVSHEWIYPYKLCLCLDSLHFEIFEQSRITRGAIMSSPILPASTVPVSGAVCVEHQVLFQVLQRLADSGGAVERRLVFTVFRFWLQNRTFAAYMPTHDVHTCHGITL